ncbi:MAG: DNA-binding protein [Cytophagaceae bacterium]|nr:DNA-binding protein [Cytophagaceae bacterium]|tara:strand:- start:172 stop:531 length:360 start_codon:yes stop_codon:yes gene_type:complete
MTEKGKFLKKFNEAFAKGDIDFLLHSITDDIYWTLYGHKHISGKEAFKREVQKMVEMETGISIHKIITHGNTASVNGIIEANDDNGKAMTLAYCDVYGLSGFKNPKIKTIETYLVKLNQ